MILIDNFNQVLAQIESERGITRDVIVSAIEQALVSACRRKFTEETILEANVDSITGESRIEQVKEIVKKVEDDELQISLTDANKVDASLKVGDEFRIDVTPEDFGRIAAQTAKQVILQRIREAEKTVIFDEFQDKIGTIITGTVQRIENQNYLINLGRVESVLFNRDQIPGESFSVKEKVRLYVVDVEQSNRGAQIRISRTHPGFLQKLFEQEIPEITDGIIEVVSVSREPGVRAKVAVKSNNPSIGAVGTCVGHMGSRIQSIIKELGFEKIDVLEWNENPVQFISNALKPAKISRVTITSEEEKTAVVVVPSDQLSLAIGKSGINVRLSVKLTGWKLDIVSEGDSDKESELLGQPKLSLEEKMKLSKESEDGDAEEAETESTLTLNKDEDDTTEESSSNEPSLSEKLMAAKEEVAESEEEKSEAVAEEEAPAEETDNAAEEETPVKTEEG